MRPPGLGLVRGLTFREAKALGLRMIQCAYIPRVDGLGSEEKEAQVPSCCRTERLADVLVLGGAEGHSREERQLALQPEGELAAHLQPGHVCLSMFRCPTHVEGGERGRETGQRQTERKRMDGHRKQSTAVKCIHSLIHSSHVF